MLTKKRKIKFIMIASIIALIFDLMFIPTTIIKFVEMHNQSSAYNEINGAYNDFVDEARKILNSDSVSIPDADRERFEEKADTLLTDYDRYSATYKSDYFTRMEIDMSEISEDILYVTSNIFEISSQKDASSKSEMTEAVRYRINNLNANKYVYHSRIVRLHTLWLCGMIVSIVLFPVTVSFTGIYTRRIIIINQRKKAAKARYLAKKAQKKANSLKSEQ